MRLLELNKDRDIFIKTCKENIKREGLDNILNYLNEETDFFKAPASTRFHLACAGGLCQHSLNVFNRLCQEWKSEYGTISEKDLEKIAIVSLFHDICKANYYKEDVRNVKENGRWVQVPYYTVNEELSLGHGEKSVMLLLMHDFKLEVDEIVAINSHMGFSDSRIRGGDWSIVNQWEQYPLGLLLHIADLKASKIDEANI